MATRNSTTARTCTPIDLGNGKVITPIRAEFGKMEFQATYHGELIAVEEGETEARNRLNEHVYDLERSGTLYTNGAESVQPSCYTCSEGGCPDCDPIKPPPAPAAPDIRVERHVRDDIVNEERFGTEIGTEFHCGQGDDEVEIYIADGEYPPELYAFGRDSIPVDDALRVLPNILALLNNPTVKQALVRKAAGAPPYFAIKRKS